MQSESRFESFELFMVLAGTGYIHWLGSPLLYKPGECWFIPASLGHFSLQPEQRAAIIRSYVPDPAASGLIL
jgi:mannose-6-phosphate isomerase